MEFAVYGLALAILALLAFAGCALMLASFAGVIRQGSWSKAMTPDTAGRWPMARKLMICGASLGVILGILSLLLMLWEEYLFQ